jgi:phenylpropionate dioxygenase-like ring-hydroxylating dioxygenase large terminal subunit
MIPNQWYVILDSKEVKKNQVIGVRRMGVNLVVWRNSKGVVGAAVDKCPHRGIALSKGKVLNDHLQCPFHGFEYDASGACKRIPANGKAATVPEHIHADVYPVTEAHGFIYLWWHEKREEKQERSTPLPPVPWFTNLGSDLVWKGFTDHWKAHYSRAIENQLDVVHVPFIHHTTIGRGIGPLVNGPYTEVGDNTLSFWPANDHDHGQTPIPPAKMTKPGKSTYLTFIFPNLWQNHIMDAMRIVVAFVPVDEKNTIFYLRTYQKMVKIPLLKDVFFFLTKLYNRIVLAQDRRVVETHQPQPSSLRMDENLIAGDYPIVLYRKRRDELQRLAGYPV